MPVGEVVVSSVVLPDSVTGLEIAEDAWVYVPLPEAGGGIGMAVDVVRVVVPEPTTVVELPGNGPAVTEVVGVMTVAVVATVVEL